MAKIEILVQARMGSTRLPGKVLKKVLGKPLLQYQLERLQRVERADSCVVLTTHLPQDDAIVDLCQSLGVAFFRGPVEDVLARYYEAASERGTEVIVRSTGDCPLVDPEVMNRVIQEFSEGKWDYVSNCLKRSFPRGLDTEVFSFAALKQAYLEAKEPSEREHVTRFIYRHPEKFSLKNVELEQGNFSEDRWTVDTEEDFQFIKHVIEALYPNKPQFDMWDVIALLHHHPEWKLINAHIVQKSD